MATGGESDGQEATGGAFAYTWGSTAGERAGDFPCDGLLPGGGVTLFRAVDVAAPAPVLYRWLCQLRVAPYSYDWLDNGGRRSPRVLTSRLDALAVGQPVMSIFTLVAFERDRHLTILMTRRRGTRLFGEVAGSYCVSSRGPAASRLVVKLVACPLPGPYGWLLRRVLPWGDWLMMRKQLLTLKKLAESTGTPHA
jgi:hypothetical protein